MSVALEALIAESDQQRQIATGVQCLVEGPHRVIVHAAGSTAGLNDWLGAPGSSKFFDGYMRTHGQRMTEELVGREIAGSFVSEDVAIQMAAAAYERALKYAVLDGQAQRPVIALAITSAVSTDRARRGEDRAFICVRTSEGFFLVDVQMDKASEGQDARDLRREEQARFIDLIALNTIFWAAGITPMILDVQGFQSAQFCPAGEGKATVVPVRIDTTPVNIFDQVFGLEVSGEEAPTISEVDWSKYVLFPGSFNPLHYGHQEMARWMEYRTGRRVVFQISQHHPIKVELAFDEDLLCERLRQFRYRHPVVITSHAGLYFDKATKFPGAHILMGADALKHMLNPKFYANWDRSILYGLSCCNNRGTIFWVVDRLVDGNLLTLEDIEIPEAYQNLFRHLAAVNEISSSQIRGQQGR
ncbi:MAG: hypothetical protein HQ488_03665 [Parcubacteria group bacterium]|nr:hypothetical protein [Parcubacteria group bacterium]